MTQAELIKLARWVGALEVDDEFTFTAEQLERIARLIIARAGRIAA